MTALISTEATSLNILLVEDHPIYREGLSLVLKKLSPSVQVCMAGSQQEAVRQLSDQLAFDLIVLDLYLPDGSALSLLRALRQRHAFVPVLVISGNPESELADSLFQAGAAGFVGKDLAGHQLLTIANRILNGEIVRPDSRRHGHPHPDKEIGLTPRQKDVLNLLARGFSNKRIGQHLDLTEHTVKTHLKSLFSSLDAHNRTECVIKAEQLGLLTGPGQTHH